LNKKEVSKQQNLRNKKGQKEYKEDQNGALAVLLWEGNISSPLCG
jgi:hypothetical protein